MKLQWAQTARYAFMIVWFIWNLTGISTTLLLSALQIINNDMIILTPNLVTSKLDKVFCKNSSYCLRLSLGVTILLHWPFDPFCILCPDFVRTPFYDGSGQETTFVCNYPFKCCKISSAILNDWICKSIFELTYWPLGDWNGLFTK